MNRTLTVAAQLIAAVAFAGGVSVGAWWLITQKSSSPSADKPPAPANVSKVVKEEELNTVSLTEEAAKRIGLTVAPVKKKATPRIRTYGGEVTVPLGRTILVAAPMGGTLKAPTTGEVKPGQMVKSGQAIFQLSPLLTPDGRATLSASLVDAEGVVNNARTQLDLAKLAIDRAKRVLNEGAGSQRQVDEADAAYKLAMKTLDASVARQAILKKVVGDAETGTAAPITIDSPESGQVRTVSVLAGQQVPSGAALFEIIDASTVWLRVPLPVGDWDTLDRAAPASVGQLGGLSREKPASAKPVNAPPSANPLASTVDIYYEMANADGHLIPGQRMGVGVPLRDSTENLSIPWSAVVLDIHGGTWIYEQLAPRKFARKRVSVSHTAGDDAVISAGLLSGTVIAIAGVQQLFAAETGFVK